MNFQQKVKLREIVCSRLQGCCFYVVDYYSKKNLFTRFLRPEKLDGLALSQLTFKIVGNKEKIKVDRLQPRYFEAMVQSGFEFGTFLNLEEMKESQILQIGLGGGTLNAFFADKLPEVSFLFLISNTLKSIPDRHDYSRDRSGHEVRSEEMVLSKGR